MTLLDTAAMQLQNAIPNALATPQDWATDYQYSGEQPLASARPNVNVGGALPSSTTDPQWVTDTKNAINNSSTFKYSGPWYLDQENIITIIVGLLLIAAGIFGFKQTQILIDNVGKIASKAAVVA